MILNALGGPVIIEKFYPHTVINAETGVVTYPEKCYFYEGFTVDPVPQSLLDEAYQQGYEAGIAEGKPYKCELEYIESTGTQYINTGFKPNNNSKLTARVKFTNGAETYPFPYGVWDSNNTNSFMFACLTKYTKARGYYGTLSQDGSCDMSGVFELIHDKNVFYVDGKKIIETSAQTFSTANNLFLFAYNNGGTVNGTTAMRLYSCQIYDNGTLVRDFIPVLDYSGEACLYDKVNKKFYYNQGTGTFDFAVKDGVIPYERELEYIESTGTQYIDTGITGAFPLSVRIKTMFASVPTTSMLMGVQVSGQSVLPVYIENSKIALVALTNVYYSNVTIKANTSYDIEVDYKNGSQTMKVNGEAVASGTTSGSGVSGNMYFFARNNGGTATHFTSARLSGLEIWQNDVLVRDFVPVLDLGGTPCLYDKANKKFYYNQGSGTFNYS